MLYLHTIPSGTIKLSLTLWKRYGKMSPKRDKSVPQLVEKYLETYPGLDRDLLRKLIRLENKIENPSELKKLDRYLRIAFKNENKKFQTTADTKKAVVQTVNQWKNVGLRFPLPSEIADEVGISPEHSEEVARKSRDQTGWSLPNAAIIDDATEKLGEVLCYLARKRGRVLKHFDYRKYPDDPEIVNIAKLGLKEHLEMLPKIDVADSWDWDAGYVAFWSSKALKYLRKNYKPRNR